MLCEWMVLFIIITLNIIITVFQDVEVVNNELYVAEIFAPIVFKVNIIAVLNISISGTNQLLPVGEFA
jgi:D-alanyl-lipoteichoic acid acyltransferase DltB (MBOAT superfamily)